MRKQIIAESTNYGKNKCFFFQITERVKSTALHSEKAILLCRAGEHYHALQVLVHQEKDLQAAEAFCSRASQGQDSQFRQSLLLTLLQIYLRSENLTGAAVDLLNNNPQVFAAEEVIQLLPDSWSVQLISQFLVGSLRETFHQRRMAKLQMALSRAEFMRHKVSLVSLMTYLTFFTAVNIVCILVLFFLTHVTLVTFFFNRLRLQKQSSLWTRSRSVRFA